MSERGSGIVGVVGTRADGCEVVCTLPEASLGERARMVSREVLPHVRGHARIADGFQLELRNAPEVRAALEHWAELERSCCQEARFEIDEQADALRLTVHGIEPSGSALAELLDARAERPASPLRRVAAAGGVGAVGAFLVLCALPMAVVAVAGASLAGPLARLESPPVLAAGALAIGAGWWWWRRPGAGRAPPRGDDCGC